MRKPVVTRLLSHSALCAAFLAVASQAVWAQEPAPPPPAAAVDDDDDGAGNGPVAVPADEPAPPVQSKRKSRRRSDSRNNIWGLRFSGVRDNLKSGEGGELIGNAAKIHLVRGYLGESWYLNGSVDVILGPYMSESADGIEANTYGTGATLWAGASAQTLNIRVPEGGYGFAMGLSYEDVSSRSSGRGLRIVDDGPQRTIISQYYARTTTVAVMPAVFFSWLQDRRPDGNTPELLDTRIEGYVFTVGLSVPLQSRYELRYLERTPGRPPVSHSRAGYLDGHTVFFSLDILFGV